MLLEYQYMKKFLTKATFQIGLKRFLWLKKLKILCRGLMLLMILMEKKTFEKILEYFTKIYCKKQIKNNSENKEKCNKENKQ